MAFAVNKTTGEVLETANDGELEELLTAFDEDGTIDQWEITEVNPKANKTPNPTEEKSSYVGDEERTKAYGGWAKMFPYTVGASMSGKTPGFAEGLKDVASLPGRFVTSLGGLYGSMGKTSEESFDGSKTGLVRGIARNPYVGMGLATAPLLGAGVATLGGPAAMNAVLNVGLQGGLAMGLEGLSMAPGMQTPGIEDNRSVEEKTLDVLKAFIYGAGGEAVGQGGNLLLKRSFLKNLDDTKKFYNKNEKSIANIVSRGTDKGVPEDVKAKIQEYYRPVVDELMRTTGLDEDAVIDQILKAGKKLDDFSNSEVVTEKLGPGEYRKPKSSTASSIGRKRSKEELDLIDEITSARGNRAELEAALADAESRGANRIRLLRQLAQQEADKAKELAYSYTERIMGLERDLYAAGRQGEESVAMRDALAERNRKEVKRILEKAARGEATPEEIQKAIELQNNSAANAGTLYEDSGLAEETLPGTIRRESNLQAKENGVMEHYNNAENLEDQALAQEASTAEEVAGLQEGIENYTNAENTASANLAVEGKSHRNKNIERGYRQLEENTRSDSPAITTNQYSQDFSRKLLKNLEKAESVTNSSLTIENGRPALNYGGKLIPSSDSRDVLRAKNVANEFYSLVFNRAKARGLGAENVKEPRIYNEDVRYYVQELVRTNNYPFAMAVLDACDWLSEAQKKDVLSAAMNHKFYQNYLDSNFEAKGERTFLGGDRKAYKVMRALPVLTGVTPKKEYLVRKATVDDVFNAWRKIKKMESEGPSTTNGLLAPTGYGLVEGIRKNQK